MTTNRKMTAGPAARSAAYQRQQAALAASRVDTRARLAAKALEEPDGIWAELLAEHDERAALRAL